MRRHALEDNKLGVILCNGSIAVRQTPIVPGVLLGCVFVKAVIWVKKEECGY